MAAPWDNDTNYPYHSGGAAQKFAEDVKRHSSRWIKKIDPYYKKFAWQSG